MMSFAHWVKYVAAVLLYYSGLFWAMRVFRRWRLGGRVVVLTYHSFSETMSYLNMAVPASLFLKQVRYLQGAFRVQTLSGWLSSRDENQRFHDDVIIITVDDGYADNYEPLLAAADRGAPSTLFVTTGCIDTAEPTSVWMVMLAIHHASADAIDLRNEGLDILQVSNVEDKEQAVRRIDTYMKPLSNQRRCEVLAQLLEKVGKRDVVKRLASTAMLDWGQIKTLHSRGVEIGAHSITHPVLSGWDAETVNREVVGSIERLRQQVGVEEVTFAYPYGSEREVSGEVVEICKRSGARAAVMLTSGDLKRCDQFKIPRKMVTAELSTSPWGSYSKAIWACELEGTLDPLKSINDFLKVM